MNRQRKVLITITYNEMGIIIDTKAEEVAQPNLQPTCNQLATDCISRQAAVAYAISGRIRTLPTSEDGENWIRVEEVRQSLLTMPSAQPEPEPVGCSGCRYECFGNRVCDVCSRFYADRYEAERRSDE